MWIEAILSTEDLRRTLSELAPLTIRLGDGQGELTLESPGEVSLVPDRGVRVVCVAQLHWPILGISVPVTMKSLIVLLRPVIEASATGDALVFKLEIEHADFAYVPTGIDNRITALINTELARKHVELSWRYPATLDHVFRLPDILHPVESLSLVVTSGVVKVTSEAVGLAVSLRCDVLRAGERGAAEERPRPDEPLEAEPPRASREQTVVRRGAPPVALLGGVAALVLGVVFTLGRLSSHRHGWLAG